MKIRIKTPLVEVEIIDEALIGQDGYTKRQLPDFQDCIKSAIDEAIKLHEAVVKSKLNP